MSDLLFININLNIKQKKAAVMELQHNRRKQQLDYILRQGANLV